MDIISGAEIDKLLGDDNLKGSGRRYALERSGYKKIGGIWQATDFGPGRRKIPVYAIRNYDQWKHADAGKLRSELQRLSFDQKFSGMEDDGADLI